MENQLQTPEQAPIPVQVLGQVPRQKPAQRKRGDMLPDLPETNFDAFLLELDSISPDLARLFSYIRDFLMSGAFFNGMPIEQDTIDYNGTPEALARTTIKFLNKAEENGDIEYKDDASKTAFQTKMKEDAKSCVREGNKLDAQCLTEKLQENAIEFKLSPLSLDNPEDNAVDHSNELSGRFEYTQGKGIQFIADNGDDIADDDKERLQMAIKKLEIFDLSQSSVEQIVMNKKNKSIETVKLLRMFPDGVTIRAAARQDADSDTSNAQVVAFHLTSPDGSLNFYIGQDSFVTPEEKWPEALKTGYEDNPDMDNQRTPDMDLKRKTDDLEKTQSDIDAIRQAAEKGDFVLAQSLKTNMLMKKNEAPFPTLKPH